MSYKMKQLIYKITIFHCETSAISTRIKQNLQRQELRWTI